MSSSEEEGEISGEPAVTIPECHSRPIHQKHHGHNPSYVLRVLLRLKRQKLRDFIGGPFATGGIKGKTEIGGNDCLKTEKIKRHCPDIRVIKLFSPLPHPQQTQTPP